MGAGIIGDLWIPLHTVISERFTSGMIAPGEFPRFPYNEIETDFYYDTKPRTYLL